MKNQGQVIDELERIEQEALKAVGGGKSAVTGGSEKRIDERIRIDDRSNQ